MQSSLMRKISLLVCDVILISLGYFIAFWLRLDVIESDNVFAISVYQDIFIATLPWLLGIRVICGVLVKQYNWSFRQASLHEAFSVATGVFAGSVLFFGISYFGNISHTHPPKSVYFLEFASTLIGMGIIRFLPRYASYILQHRFARFKVDEEGAMKTLIFGAGHTGQLLLRDIMHSGKYPYQVIGYIDDNPVKIGTRILGVPVLGNLEDLHEIIGRKKIDKVLISTARLSSSKLRHLVDICSGHNIRFKKIPSYNEIVQQGTQPLALQELKLEDLLRRDSVTFDNAKLSEYFIGKTVLVTGAAGSIGSELCRQLAGFGIKNLVAVDHNENGLYFLKLELHEINADLKFDIAFGSVRSAKRVGEIFEEYKPDIVFHAAAHKHVPLMEDCPREALANNVLGTINVAECARRINVERFVLISTDKAVRPTNIMGATKYMAEVAVRKIAQQVQRENGKSNFMAVRFGNVLGSAGSLIPILQRQIRKGGPVTITHPQITRYFMTIPEAVGLVIIASVANEGATCVLDMGEPVKIDEIARHLITLNGLVPESDIAIKYIGLRPGEKMYEELFLDEEKLTNSSHPRIMVAHPVDNNYDLQKIEAEVAAEVESGDDISARALLEKYVPGNLNGKN